jgi:ABC-type transport system substrate-binding protein
MASTAKPKVLRVGFLTSVVHLEPAAAHDVESSFVLRHIFEAPFDTAYGSTELEPRLFRGPLQARGATLEAELRDDVSFSDGTRLTAADVADSLRAAALIAAQASVRALGNRLFFTLQRPNARFDMALSHFECSVVRRAGGRLLGTGPYMLAPESTATLVRLVRNPHHRPAAPIDEVHFRAYVPDADGRATALLAAIEDGTVDLSLSLGRQDIEAARNVRKSILPGVSTAILFLNCESPRLRDARVRRALARAIDRFEIARSSYANPLAFVATSLTPRPLGPLDDGLSHDLTQARALLSAPDVARPDQRDLLLVWAPRPYLPYPQKVAQIVVEQFGRLGISVTVHQPASGQEFTDAVKRGTYDLTLAGWVADTMDPHDFLEALLASNRVLTADNAAVACNMGRLRSPEMDSALERLRAERDSTTLQAIVDIVDREAPLVPLMYGPTAAVHSYRVRNFKPSPLWYVPVERLDVDD